MAYKATRNTYGFAYSRDAFGNATALRVSIMAGQEFPPGTEPDPDDKGSVEEFEHEAYAGPQYSEGYTEVDKRLTRSDEKDDKARERARTRGERLQTDAQKLGHGKATK